MDFSSDDIGNPTFSYSEVEEKVPVTLYCNFMILRGIEKWKNITYKIEWFVDGTFAKKDIICKPGKESKENKRPCPDRNPFRAELTGRNKPGGPGHYTAGQTVS